MSGKFRGGTHIFSIPLGRWNTKIQVLCVRILGKQIRPGSRSNSKLIYTFFLFTSYLFVKGYKCTCVVKM